MRHGPRPKDPDAVRHRLTILAVDSPVAQDGDRLCVRFTGRIEDRHGFTLSVIHSLPAERAQAMIAQLREAGARADVLGHSMVNVNGRVRSYFEASEVTVIGVLDGAVRAAEKQASRDADLVALAAGETTVADLNRRNSFFAGLDLSTFRIHAIGKTLIEDIR
jgi:hypothetical protein